MIIQRFMTKLDYIYIIKSTLHQLPGTITPKEFPGLDNSGRKCL